MGSHTVLPELLQLNNSTPIVERIIHVVIDESSELPFNSYQVEEMRYYHWNLPQKKLCSDIVYCDLPLLMYE